MSGSYRSHTVVMPKLGLTMTKATLVKWYKRDGEKVEKGEMLFALESDKALLEIEAPASGILRILVPAGETVPVMEPIAEIVSAEEPKQPTICAPTEESRAAQGVLTPVQKQEVAHQRPQERLRASPKARALARQRGLSLLNVRGTGPRGMIVSADLETVPCFTPTIRATPVARKIAAMAGLELGTITGTGPGGQVTRRDVEQALAAGFGPSAPTAVSFPQTRTSLEKVSPEEHEERGEPQIQPLTGLRAVIAERLSTGWRERPQVTLTTEVEATNLVSARQQIIAETGEKVSYDAFMVVLAARALREHPHVNVRLTAAGIEKLPEINIGVAVDTERGLLVPVIRDAASKNLLEIHRILQELSERAKSGTLLPDELSGGTFTITNLGMYEIDAFTPIINPPECAILGIGRILNKPVSVNGQIVLRDMITLSLSFDHRLIDGAPAARFLQRIKQLIERPFALLVMD